MKFRKWTVEVLEKQKKVVFPIFKPGTGYVSIFQLSPYFSQLSIKQLYLVLILKDEGRFGSQLWTRQFLKNFEEKLTKALNDIYSR